MIHLFNSEEFLDFVERLIGKKIGKAKIKIKKFRHKDYTLLHDEEMKKEKEKRLEFFFFICEDWNFLYGGNKIFVIGEKNEKTFVFTPSGNSFSLVNKDKNIKEFVQYVKHFARDREFVIVEGWLERDAPTIFKTSG